MHQVESTIHPNGSVTYNYRTDDGRKVCAWWSANEWMFMVFAPHLPGKYACIGEFTARGVSHADLLPIIESALLVLPEVAAVA